MALCSNFFQAGWRGGLPSIRISDCIAFFALVLVLSCLPVTNSAAAESSSAVSSNSSRFYLIVVENSIAMKSRMDGITKVVEGFLNTGFKGQLRDGDRLDVWSFNETLARSSLPVQLWSAGTRASISVGLLDFLLAQKYDKKANFGTILPEINRLLTNSPFVTVILLTSGENTVEGTACDGLINEAFGHWREQQRQAQMPLVILMRAVRGQVIECNVVPAPEQLPLPPWPAEQPAAQSPLVLESKPVAPPTSPQTNAPRVAAKKTKKAPKSAATSTNSVPVQRTNDVAPSPAPVPKPESATVAPEATEPPPRPTPNPSAPAPPPVATTTLSATTNQPPAAFADPAPPEPRVTLAQAQPAPPASNPSQTVREPAPVSKPESTATVSQAIEPPRNAENPSPVSQLPAPIDASETPVPAASPANSQSAQAPNSRRDPPPTKAAEAVHPFNTPGFFRANASFILLLLAAGVGAIFFFLNWLRTFMGPPRE